MFEILCGTCNTEATFNAAHTSPEDAAFCKTCNGDITIADLHIVQDESLESNITEQVSGPVNVALPHIVRTCREMGVSTVLTEDGDYVGVKDRIMSSVTFETSLECYVYAFTEMRQNLLTIARQI